MATIAISEPQSPSPSPTPRASGISSPRQITEMISTHLAPAVAARRRPSNKRRHNSQHHHHNHPPHPSPTQALAQKSPIFETPASTQTPTEPTPDPTSNLLFRLPRELRDRIYSHLLISDQAFWWPSERSTPSLTPSLLRVSRAIYAETAPLLYSLNKFMFSHPSDCNIFRVIMDRHHSPLISNICLRIRDKDVRLWTAYLGSTLKHRSLYADLPNLRTLWIFYRSLSWDPLSDALENYRNWQADVKLNELCLALEGKTKAEVRIICCHRIPRHHFEQLGRAVGGELMVDPDGDARSQFLRVGGVCVALELSCPEMGGRMEV